MSTLKTIVQRTITKATAQLTRQGFGTILLLMTHENVAAGVAKVYGSVDDFELDGFTSNDLVHKAATRVFSQNPKVTQVVLGKRSNQPTRTVKLTPSAFLVPSVAYRVTVNATPFDFTTDATPTAAEISAGLVAALNQDAWIAVTAYLVGDYVRNGGNVYIATVAGTSAGAGGPTGTGSGIVDGTVTWSFKGLEVNIKATDNTGDLDVASADTPGGSVTAGIPFTIEFDRSRFDFNDNTVDVGGAAGIAQDLSDVRDVNDSWYGVTGDWWDESTATAMANAVEALDKLHGWTNHDTDVLDAAVTTDVFSVLQAAGFERSGAMWHTREDEFVMAGWMGVMFTFDAGNATWKFKTIKGVTFDEFTTAEFNALGNELVKGKSANYYIQVSGLSMASQGVVHQSEFFDTVRFLDALDQRMGEDVFLHIKSQPKVPYTDLGFASIQNIMEGVLVLGTTEEGGLGAGLATDPAPVVTVPLVASIDASTRASRVAPDFNFAATLSGAVHAAQITGTVSA